MFDFMYKATDKAAWDSYLESFSEELRTTLLVDEIGPIEITPPQFDSEGNIVQEGVVDLSHHVNLRYLNNDETIASGFTQGNEDVTWINPTMVDTPYRIWAGGMNYYG
jgi:hypothetical protein